MQAQWNNLHCIDLDQSSLPGFRQFISAWYYGGKGFNLVVDPGPLSSISHLIHRLKALGVETLDYILLTHIHIDHAGGSAALLRQYPMARIICHPEGIRHLVAPERLWKGSKAVLGALADAYGEILPVPENSIGYEQEIGDTGIRVHQTPGHAQHHLCFEMGDLLFAGEVAGVRCETQSGIYLRPATPPRFILEVALNSLEKMKALSPTHLAFAHYGLVDNALQYLELATTQLKLWVRAAKETKEASNRQEAMMDWLLKSDECILHLKQLPEDIQIRERQFFANSFRGMIEYVDNLDG